ncbi:lipopolysaccharide core heptosyltransferase RfaQ [[Pantoea] beijingensis]|uniref:Lipopolysaccharide core heptosyltransferase RfaQ n=1 Tax=[Pantoea] beijingensis TaxID=1324864 RepID=A0A443IGJ3_9GAMM|nr:MULTISPECIES: lipopolysaccharide core heptosyltransferase RfaQ [Erwiniaceae]RWR03195.1 lipopolysaccharide core heptosyltransferase RfaQ [[Pantoea] beijingensis]
MKKINKILICKLKFHGDMLLTTPLIATLNHLYPEAKIDILLYKETKSLLSADKRINTFYEIEKTPSLVKKVANFFNVRSALKKKNHDIIINLTDQWPIALLLASLNQYSIAFKRGKKTWNRLFTKVVPSQGEHIIEQNLSILQALDVPENKLIKTLSLYYNESDYQSLFTIDSSFNSNKYVVIQPTARQPFKCWDDEKFAALINKLHHDGLDVMLTSGPSTEDLAQVKRIAALCQRPPNSQFAGKTTFLQLAALIDHAELYIGVDSAPMHMAAALDIPQVCMFGATNYKQWRPWSDKATVLWAGNYQKMPERRHLDRSKKYLSCIPADDVIHEAEVLLNKFATR